MSEEDILGRRADQKAAGDLNLNSLTQPDVAKHAEHDKAAQHPEMTKEEEKHVKELAKNDDKTKELLMRCPVAGKVLASADKQHDKKEA